MLFQEANLKGTFHLSVIKRKKMKLQGTTSKASNVLALDYPDISQPGNLLSRLSYIPSIS